MKTYYICAALIFVSAYAIFHFGFRTGGATQLYRINDRIAFELYEPGEGSSGIAVRGYQQTNSFVKFICGACQHDSASEVDMVNANYRTGDFVFSDFPQHEKCPTDIVNLKTGEAINVELPADFKFRDDLSKLAEYRERGLAKSDENKLTQDYVTANFQPLSTFTDRCIYIHLLFLVAGLFLAFPIHFLWVALAILQGFDSSE